jgi:hypothetical protein
MGYLLAALHYAPGSQPKRLHLSAALKMLLAYLLSLAPPALLLAGYNWLRAGDPLETGYDLSLFSSSLWLGLYKLLFSPLRGLFIYSPLLILSILGLVWLWQEHQHEAALTTGVVSITILVFSIWSSGEGLSWGSRFLIPAIPFLCLALAPVLERALAGARLLAGLLAGLAVLSFAIQFLGVAINPWIYLAGLQAEFGGEFFLENTPALTDFRYTQVLGQLQSWSPTNSDVAWWQPGFFDALALGLSLFLVAAAIIHLWTMLSGPLPPVSYSIVTLGLLLIGAYLLLARYYRTDQRQFGPLDDAYTRALNTAASQAGAGECIVTVAPNHYHVPMNRFKARVPIIGFARQQPPVPGNALPLLRQALAGRSAWLITVGFPPAAADNAVEEWLTLHAYKASDRWFDDARLVWYGAGAPMANRPMEARLGKELRLVQVRLSESLPTGQVLPVELVWLAEDTPRANYNLFLQLLSADGRLVAQHDGPPNGGYSPTSSWAAGQEILDRHGLPLADGLPAGEYHLIAGLYDPATGKRVPVAGGVDFLDLGTVSVQ